VGGRATWAVGALLATAPAVASATVDDPESPVPGQTRDPAATPSPSPAPPGPDAPGPEREGVPDLGGEGPGPLPLLDPVQLGRAAGWFFPPEPTPSDRGEEAEANLERYFDEALGRDRIERGQVDGWYYEVARSMRREFRPDRQRVESERHRGMTLLQRAWDELRRYAGGPERPQDVPGQYTPEMRGGTALTTDPTDRRAAIEQEEWDHCNPLNGAVTWYRADVRVTHNPEGELSAAWILRSSGIEALDDAALDAARAGSMTLLPPPDDVVGERQAIRSDWAFEMGDVATPWICMSNPLNPTPVVPVSCVDDPVLGLQCAMFGRGIIRTRIRLLAVVDADHLTPEERRAARRRERLDNQAVPE